MKISKLIFLVMLIGIFNIAAINAGESIKYTITEPYPYDNLQWGDAFNEEQFNVNQDILDQMTTEALMYTALYCPNITDGHAYDWPHAYSSWVDRYKTENNVFATFINRPDAIEVVYRHYCLIDPHKYDYITEIPAEYEDMYASKENYDWWQEKLISDRMLHLLKAACCEQGQQKILISYLQKANQVQLFVKSLTQFVLSFSISALGAAIYYFAAKPREKKQIPDTKRDETR